MPKFSSVQSKNKNFGGVEKASSSVLKLVSTIHRIGKKMRNPIAQAATVVKVRRWTDTARAMVSRLQVSSDHADEKECDDIGEDHRDNAAGRSTADIELQQGLGVDHERDIRRCIPAAGGDTDFREDIQQEDRLDQDDDGDRAGNVREHDIEEERDRRRAVHLGRLLLLLVERL